MGSQQQQEKLLILMTLVDGPNLHDVIFGETYQVHGVCLCVGEGFTIFYFIQLSITTKFHVAIQLCQAVTFLHTNSPPLAHLDIKPSNILVRFKQHNISVLSRVLYKYMYVCIICRVNQRRGKFFLGILVSARLCQELMSLEQKRCWQAVQVFSPLNSSEMKV